MNRYYQFTFSRAYTQIRAALPQTRRKGKSVKLLKDRKNDNLPVRVLCGHWMHLGCLNKVCAISVCLIFVFYSFVDVFAFITCVYMFTDACVLC